MWVRAGNAPTQGETQRRVYVGGPHYTVSERHMRGVFAKCCFHYHYRSVRASRVTEKNGQVSYEVKGSIVFGKTCRALLQGGIAVECSPRTVFMTVSG